jgi:hypothetical protein
MEGWERIAIRTGLKLHTSGLPSLCHFSFEHEQELVLTTLFTQLMLDRGYLAYNQFKPSFAHTSEHVESYLATVEEVFDVLAKAITQKDLRARLRGPVAQRGFYRLA